MNSNIKLKIKIKVAQNSGKKRSASDLAVETQQQPKSNTDLAAEVCDHIREKSSNNKIEKLEPPTDVQPLGNYKRIVAVLYNDESRQQALIKLSDLSDEERKFFTFVRDYHHRERGTGQLEVDFVNAVTKLNYESIQEDIQNIDATIKKRIDDFSENGFPFSESEWKNMMISFYKSIPDWYWTCDIEIINKYMTMDGTLNIYLSSYC